MMGRAPEKPTYGSPCNGCGYCCAAERCPIAEELIGEGPGPCPALEFENGRFWCGFLRNASQYVAQKPDMPDELYDAAVRTALIEFFGNGCDSEDPEGYRSGSM